MRRVSSYGGPSGVAGSERLRLRLSSTPGLHLLSSSPLEETGFLAIAGDPQDERVFHRTYGAARNFYAIASNLKQVAKREPWLTRTDFGPVVKGTIVLDEPVDVDEHCHGGAPAVLVQKVEENHCSPGQNDSGTGEGGVEGVHEVSFNGSQVVEEVELEKCTGASSASEDHLFGLPDSQGCESSLLGTRLVANEQVERLDLETEQPSIYRLEVEDSLSTSPICAGQDAQPSRTGKCEAAIADNEDILSSEKSQEVETGAGLHDSESDRCKDVSAVNIQRYWRGWLERKHYREVKGRIVFLQSLVRRNQELKHYHGIMQAAVVLQTHWRVLQSVQALKRLKLEQALREQRKVYDAAIVVQKYRRSVRSRRLLNNLRKELYITAQNRNNHATLVLQKHWRAQRGRYLVKRLKLEQVAREQERTEDAAVVLQKHWRARRGRCLVKYLKMEQAVEEKQRIDDAAVVMQKHWRARRGRCLVKQLKTEHVVMEQKRIHDATVMLQKCWRAQQGRRSVELLKLELAAREQLRTRNAAIVLQKYWRAKEGRFALRCLKAEQVAREQLRMDNAAIVLQKHWRAMQGRCLLKHLKMDKVARETQRTIDAAVVVQKLWRAKQGRSFEKDLKLELVAKEQRRSDHAAIAIQKLWRSQQGKCLVKRLRLEQAVRETQKIEHAAVVIQKHFRAQQARCSIVNRMRTEEAVREKQRIDQATIVLQKHWRGRCGRILVQHKKMELGVKKLQGIDHAAINLQKLWRARQSRVLVEHMRMEQLVTQRKMDDATMVLQKHWRGRQSRCLVTDLKEKHLKIELASREKHRASAATTLQKQWRAWQSILFVKRLKTEAAVRDQQRLDNAATIFQKCWRGRRSRLLLKHLKTVQASRKLKRVNNAALVLQKNWRIFRSKQMVKFLYLQQAARERAAVCIQARVRGNATRVKLKAALSIQKAWQLYWSSRVNVSAVCIQRAFLSSSDENRKIQAIIVLQAYVCGLADRRRLAQMPKPGTLSVQPSHINKTLTDTCVAADASPHMILSGSDLYARCLSEAENTLESSPSSSIVHQIDTDVKSVDQTQSSPISSLKHDPYGSQGLDGEYSATSVGHVESQKNGVQEDWNYVAVDQLEECLDTCLAALRPLPSGSQHCLPGLDVPENAQQFITADQNVENRKNADKLSVNTYEVVQQVPRTRSDTGEPDNRPSTLNGSALNESRTRSDLVTSQATPIGGTDHLEFSSGPLQEKGSKEMENPVQVRNLGRQTLKQNEQRLKQFAEVFLLRRHIALQQQRAQAAPPFPPPMPSGSEIPSQVVNQPLEVESREHGDVAISSTSVHTHAKLSQVDAGRPTEDHIVCEITDPSDEQTASRNSQADQNAGAKQVVERPGPDVVLDMVLLLRRIEAEYGTSEANFEGESSTWCTSGCGDVEEGVPLLDRNSGSMRRESSVAKFANAVSMKHISIPDVNAVLLVFIAMVVYTRTVCKGLFFGARQTHRRP